MAQYRGVPRPLFRLLLVLSAVSFLEGSAAAEDDPPLDNKPITFLAMHFGLNTPVGAIGVEAGVGQSWFRASVSGGFGFRGLEYGAMVRVVTPGAIQLYGTQFGLGAGISRGPGLHTLNISLGEGDDDDESPESFHYGSNTLWGNLELVAERSLIGGSFMRVYVGATTALYMTCSAKLRATDMTVPCSAESKFELENERFLPYFGIAYGVRFPAPPRHPGAWRGPGPWIPNLPPAPFPPPHY